MKIGRLIIVASSSLAFIGAAHATGRSGPSATPLAAFAADVAAPPGATRAPDGAVVPPKGQIVRASWYGGGERLSQHTSSGDIFRPMGQTAAHRTLPFGTMLRVSSLDTGRSTVVRINDRGPAASTGRALDLSRGAAIALGIAGRGEAKVAIEVMR